MRKILYALSVAVLAGFAPALAQDAPRLSFAETVKFLLFADSSKSERIHKATDGITTKLALTDSDETTCSAGMIIQQDKPNHGETKATLTLDFMAVYNWRRSGSAFILEGGIRQPVLKSIKIEWLRIDTDKAKDEKKRSDEIFFANSFSFPLPPEGDEQRASEAMDYLMDKLCARIIHFGPSTKF